VTKPVAKFAAVLLFALIPLMVLSIDEDKMGATVKEQIDWNAHNVTVLFFILHDCPISNRYVPRMNQIVQDYRDRGFGFVAVYPESDFSREEAQKHARDYHFDFPFVIDSDLRFAAELGIKVVPQVAVLNRKRELLYRGRIDDLYADIDKQRPAATRRDLREALENIAAGIKPTCPWGPAVGCPIGYDQPGS
jgi:peroxiredoxin